MTQEQTILGELAFQQGGVTNPAQATALGRLLNVQFIVTGRVTRLVGAYQVNAQMIDVSTGEIVRSESVIHRGDFVALMTGRMPRLAARLAQAEEPQQPAPASAPVTTAPPAPPSEPARARWRPGSTMHGGTAAWPLIVGGAMVMGAAMTAGHADGQARDAALAVGVIGAGLLGYSWIDRSATPDAAWAEDSPTGPRPLVLVDLRRDGIGAGIAWRW